MTKFKEWPDADVDVLVGGTPCQSFSVAGLRKGLADPRGNLMLTYFAIAAKYRPKWVVWENVPGVLSSNGGLDFAAFLRGLGEVGYGFAYRILDAQYFGVPQRRRRVFVVGCLGDWRRAAAVLFERHSLQGHPAPSRKKGERVAASLVSDSKTSGGIGMDNQALFSQNGDNLVRWPSDVAPTLDAHYGDKQGLENQHINAGGGCSFPELSLCLNAGGMGRQDAESETLIPTRGGHFGEPYAFPWQQGGTLGMSGTLVKNQTMAVSYSILGNAIGRQDHNGPNGHCIEEELAPCQTKNDKHGVIAGMQVRRLTPVECERLQGFPDGYTDIKPNGKPTADGPRYKALGNSMAVPVMAWIGRRIQMVDELRQESRVAA